MRGGPTRRRGQGAVPRDDEPRDPRADERGHRHDPALARDAAQRRAARLRGRRARCGSGAPDHHQRHPGPVAHGGRPARARLRRLRPARAAREGDQDRGAPRAAQRPGSSSGGDAGGAEDAARRSGPASPDPAESPRQRREVHLRGRGRAPGPGRGRPRRPGGDRHHRARHRRGDPQAPARSSVHPIRPGRSFGAATLRRQRSRPEHLPAPGGPDGRRHRAGEPAGQGRHVRGQPGSGQRPGWPGEPRCRPR